MKTNESNSQLGVWMDHSVAKLIHQNGIIKEIKLNHTHRTPGESGSGTRLGNYRSTNDEVHRHNKENNMQHDYYKEIYKSIMPYNDIIVFGPSTAPQEFHNYILKLDHHQHAKMTVEKADYMTDEQLVAFVNKYFLMNHS